MKTLLQLLTTSSLIIASTFALAGGQGDIMQEALDAMENSDDVYVNDKWDYIRFKPRSGIEKQDVCFVMYPGALLDPRVYAPYGQELASRGYYTYILKVPVGLAIFEPNAADDVMDDYYAEKYCDHFVIAGHSLGGVVATDYVDAHPEHGLVLLASYPQAGTDISDQSSIVSSIYGTNDCQTTPADVSNAAAQLPASTTYVEIVGGNHQQFGWYTESVDAECEATVSRQYQFDIVIDTIVDNLEAH